MRGQDRFARGSITRRSIFKGDEERSPAMDGSDSPLWERPVRWPAEGLPFDMRALRYVLAAAEQMSFSGAAGALVRREGRADLGLDLRDRR